MSGCVPYVDGGSVEVDQEGRTKGEEGRNE